MISSSLYLTELSKSNTFSRSTSSNFFKSKQTPNSTVKTFYKTKKSSSSSNIQYNSINNSNWSSFTINNKHQALTPKKKTFFKNRDKKMKDTVIQLRKQRKTTSQFQEEFLSFLIHERTQFAELSSIEQHYYKGILHHYNTCNMNRNIIQSKKNEIKRLSYEIAKTLFQYMDLNENNDIHIYNNEILKLKREIKLKQIEYNSYKHLYSRSYKTHYLLSKQYEDEIKYDKMNNAQYEKYKILKEHAVNSVSKQSEMLANMQKFKELSEETYSNQISQKTKLYNQLDFEVLMIKKDTASIENALNAKIAQQNETKILLSHQYALNKKYMNDYLYFAKEYHSTNMKLLNVYRILNVKSLFNVIKQFNVLKKEYNLLHFRFEQVNYDIAKLNIQLTEMEKEIESIKEQIEIKHKENMKPQDELILAVSSQISTQKYFNEILEDSFKEKENLVKLMINYLNNYMLKILNSIQNSMMHCNFSTKTQIEKYQKIFSYDDNKDSCMSSYTGSPLYSKSNVNDNHNIKRKKTKRKSNMENETDVTYNQKFTNLFQEFDKNLFIFVFNLFNDFTHDFFVLLSNVFNYISLTEESLSQEHHSNTTNTKHFEIVLYNSPSFQSSVHKHTSLAIIRQHDKLKILGRSEKDIFDSQKKKLITNQTDSDSSRMKKNQITISGKHLYKSYIHYISNIPSIYNKSTYTFVQKYPTRSISVMERYTNDLVDKNYTRNKDKAERRERVQNRSIEIVNNMKTKQLQKLLRIKKEQMGKLDQDEEEYDLDEDEYKNRTVIEFEKLNEELKRNQMKRKFNMNTANCELNRIYMRLDDLRNLEFNYFNEKNKGDAVNKRNLNEIYYNFKKKFYQNGKKRFSCGNTVKSRNGEKLPCFSQERRSRKGNWTSYNGRNYKRIEFSSNKTMKGRSSSLINGKIMYDVI